MASYSYGSESTTKISNSSNASSWTGYWLLSSINEQIKSKIKDYSNISNFKFTVYAKENGGTFNSDIDIFFAKSDNSSLSSLHSGDNCVYDSGYSNWTLSGVASAVQSGNKNAGRIVYSSADRICIKLAKTTSLGTNRTWSAYYTISCDYTPPTFVISLSAGAGGTVSGAGTYNVDSSATIKATPNSGYRFVKWSDGNTSATRTITKTTSDISANVTNLSYTATFEKIEYTATFKNADGTVVKSLTVQSGSTLGTLPTVSRSGYTFGGWIPCAPAVKTDGTVLDSRQYLGDEASAQALHTKYKDYTNKFAIHIEAHMSNWSELKTLNAQIMSCTESGGWGLGYQARSGTTGGTEIYNGNGYKIIDLGFASDEGLKALNNDTDKSKNWHSIDLVFSEGTYKAYLDGVEKGTQTLSSTSLSYNSSNTIFVGAEAAKDTVTPATNSYFKGFISNVFIANQGTRLVTATSSTTITGNVDYYPVWRLNPTYTITASAENGSVSGGGTYEEGKTATLTATPNAGYKFKQWSDGNTDNPRTVKVTGDATYTAEFEAAAPEFLAAQLLYGDQQVSQNNKVKAGEGFRIIIDVQ